MAEVDAAEGFAERAAVLASASAALRAAIGSPIPAPDLARYNESAAAAELALGPGRFSAARTRGETMDVEQAMALAREAGREEER